MSRTSSSDMRKRSRPSGAARTVVRRWSWLQALRYFMAITVTVGTAGAAVLLIESIMQTPVDRVVFSGEFAHLDATVAKRRVQPYLDSGLPNTDLPAIKSDLEALPWIKRVELRRRWPGTLEITVTERTPIARWGDRGLVDFDGTVFEPAVIDSMLELPRLSGPEESHAEVFRHYRRFVEFAQAYDLGLLELSMDSRGSWRVLLDNETELMLGRVNIGDRIQRFLASQEALQNNSDQWMARADMRYGNGVAITWREGKDQSSGLQSATLAVNQLEGEHPANGQRTGT